MGMPHSLAAGHHLTQWALLAREGCHLCSLPHLDRHSRYGHPHLERGGDHHALHRWCNHGSCSSSICSRFIGFSEVNYRSACAYGNGER